MTQLTEHIHEVVEACMPHLAGHASEIQGGALAELLAIHLTGCVTPSKEGTAQLREALLAAHIEAVRSFIPVIEEMSSGGVRH